MASQREAGGGCGAIIAIVILIALVVGAVVSVAALIDPFDWMPSLGEIFGDCNDTTEIPGDECELAKRYPGFWGHVIVNFVYALVALGLLVAFASVLPEFRRARGVRFASGAALDRYRQARGNLTLVAALLGGVAALPIVAALV